jgi:hypothetical protein
VNDSKTIIQAIERTGVTFFQDFTNFKPEPGYGLTVDHTGDLNLSSIASTGFFLSSLVIGVAQGYLKRDVAVKQAIGTLETLAYRVPHYEGFFAHFLDIHTAQRMKICEYSTIDTALALNGVITVDSYFQDPRIRELSTLILKRVNWDILIHNRAEKTHFYMAYNPDKHGDYVTGKPGYIHHWSMLAEQLMMYVMYASNAKDLQLAKKLYHDFERKHVTYRQASYLYTPGNTLFVYQYPQCWLGLKDWRDDQGLDWFNNTKEATYGHYYLSRDLVKQFPTFGEHYFGFTASYGRKGYQVSGAIPNVNNQVHHDGSVAPNAMIGSLIFTPELALPAIQSLYQDSRLWDARYGFINAFNDEPPVWLSQRWLGIDKGLELLMANAYLHGDVMKAYMNHPLIQQGMTNLGWKKIT